MASEFTIPARARVLIISLGIALVAMLAASLAERFTSTGLTVRHTHEPAAQAPAPGTDEVGRLMQEVAKDPGNKAALVEIAERLMTMGSWDGAESFATRALALDPRDGRTRYLLGVIRHNQGKHAEAAKLLEEALRDKDSAAMRYSLGVLYLHYLNEPARGVEHLTEALHAPDADESLRQAIREELEKAPLPAGEGAEEKLVGAPSGDAAKAAASKKGRPAKTGGQPAGTR
ncbi:MAG: tetratricopeptide repeat protein [Desulfovibrio sp.]|uniref:tetratricopeptide repeat protein n=1 Tax=Desulfovibrio sp. TaxID=885 RepID=UPI001A781C73|nr:tetratricopeptide repeat protein [Desulfovibrio sp.]MBD5416179.1 tetratricopeptide repeat protein [Desulfovibrio sp.]